MRSSYKSPVIWAVVVSGLVLAGLGQLFALLLGDNYLSWTATQGGLLIAGLFGLCVVANFVGTRFATEAEWVKTLPTRVILGVAFADLLTLFAIMAFGGESKWMVPLVFVMAGSIILLVPFAFFVRGMTVPTEHDS